MNNSRLSQLKSFLESNPKDSFVHFAMALEFIKIGEEETAFTHFDFILKNDPDYVGLYYHLGKWYERQDDEDSAEKIYLKGMEIAKSQNETHALGELRTAYDLISDEY